MDCEVHGLHMDVQKALRPPGRMGESSAWSAMRKLLLLSTQQLF